MLKAGVSIKIKHFSLCDYVCRNIVIDRIYSENAFFVFLNVIWYNYFGSVPHANMGCCWTKLLDFMLIIHMESNMNCILLWLR